MTPRKTKLTVALVIALMPLISGCYVDSAKTSVEFSGNMSIENESFRMDGEIRNSAITSEPETFENVSVSLYTEDKKLIKSVNIGTLRYEQDVNIRSPTVPTYVIIYSPDFWRDNSLFFGEEPPEVVYFERKGDIYRSRVVSEEKDLPVIPE